MVALKGQMCFQASLAKLSRHANNCQWCSTVPSCLTTVQLWMEQISDEQYMYDMCIAVSSGQCSPDLALQKPGPIVHSRWLTMANRVLRLCVATNNPSDNLQTLVVYVMKVYAPIWFHVKTKPLCSDGARHLWRLIKYTRYLSPELRKIVDPVIQRNGFFGHSENILLAMIMDSRK